MNKPVRVCLTSVLAAGLTLLPVPEASARSSSSRSAASRSHSAKTWSRPSRAHNQSQNHATPATPETSYRRYPSGFWYWWFWRDDDCDDAEDFRNDPECQKLLK